MNFSKMSIDEMVYQSGLRINNSLSDSEILNAVSPFGYTETKLNEGVALLGETMSIVEAQRKEYGEVDEAQNRYENERKAANQEYMDTLRICRVAFKDDVKAIATLGLNGRRARTLSGWFDQTRSFYRSLLGNEEWKTTLATYGQTEEKLEERLNAVAQVEQASMAVKKEMGDAQNATHERDMKLEELADWVNDYEVIARIALAGKPQLLEKLGIVVKS